MVKPKVFIGSSEANSRVARAIADELEQSANVTVWNEGVFRLNDSFLDDLFAAPNQFDFAVMVWAPDDVTDSKGQSLASPRDNVIFESGLFMGMLGLDHVFVVQDQECPTKIPSDFAGITLATYDGTRIAEEPQAAVRSACSLIEAEMSKAPLKKIVGQWRQRYMESGAVVPRQMEEDIEVAAFKNTVSFVRYCDQRKEVVFEARGKVGGNRIRGEWRNASPRGWIMDHFCWFSIRPATSCTAIPALTTRPEARCSRPGFWRRRPDGRRRTSMNCSRGGRRH